MDSGDGTGSRERLTRERICEAALQAIDEAGLESVSMRHLASALGVKASSLYYHFRSKDDLLTGVADYLYRELGRLPSEGDWTEQVRGTFIQLQDFIQAHPNASPLLVRDLAYSPTAKKRANVLLRRICGGGLSPAASSALVSNLMALLVGHSLLALWMESETGRTTDEGAAEDTGDGPGEGRGPRVQRAWVHKLFRTEGPGSDGIPESDGVGSQVFMEFDGQPAARFVPGSTTATELPGDTAVFVAGVEALLKGFTVS